MVAKFKSFLAGAPYKMDEDSVEMWTYQVAVKLPSVLRTWYDPDFATIEAKDAAYFEKARKKLAALSGFKKNCADAPMMLQALKYFCGFLEDEHRKAGLGKTTRKPKLAGSSLVAGGGHVASPQPLGTMTEGEVVAAHFAKHERNLALRAACIEHYRAQHAGEIVCEACGLGFGKRYGKIGEGYIEVHHLRPISQTEGVHSVDPKTDLVPLCAHCPAMIHRLMADEKKVSGRELEGASALAKLRALIEEDA